MGPFQPEPGVQKINLKSCLHPILVKPYFYMSCTSDYRIVHDSKLLLKEDVP